MMELVIKLKLITMASCTNCFVKQLMNLSNLNSHSRIRNTKLQILLFDDLCMLYSQAGPDDIRNFDTTFTEEMVPYSVCISSDCNIVNASVLEADDAFIGFSYAPPSEDIFR